MGIISTLIATIITYPLQTLRTRIQAKITPPASIAVNDSRVVLFKGFHFKVMSVIFHGFIFYYIQKVVSNIVL